MLYKARHKALKAIRDHVSDPLGETLEFLKRDALNLALRNTAIRLMQRVSRLTQPEFSKHRSVSTASLRQMLRDLRGAHQGAVTG